MALINFIDKIISGTDNTPFNISVFVTAATASKGLYSPGLRVTQIKEHNVLNI